MITVPKQACAHCLHMGRNFVLMGYKGLCTWQPQPCAHGNHRPVTWQPQACAHGNHRPVHMANTSLCHMATTGLSHGNHRSAAHGYWFCVGWLHRPVWCKHSAYFTCVLYITRFGHLSIFVIISTKSFIPVLYICPLYHTSTQT